MNIHNSIYNFKNNRLSATVYTFKNYGISVTMQTFKNYGIDKLYLEEQWNIRNLKNNGI